MYPGRCRLVNSRILLSFLYAAWIRWYWKAKNHKILSKLLSCRLTFETIAWMASIVDKQCSPKLWYRQKLVRAGGRVTLTTEEGMVRLMVFAWDQVPSMTITVLVLVQSTSLVCLASFEGNNTTDDDKSESTKLSPIQTWSGPHKIRACTAVLFPSSSRGSLIMWRLNGSFGTKGRVIEGLGTKQV